MEAINAFTLVYNMKIRRAFIIGSDYPMEGKEKKSLIFATAVPIVFKRKRHIVSDLPKVDVFESDAVGGVLFNVRYMPSKNWWFEGSTGIEKEQSKLCGTYNFLNKRAGFDDFVFTLGYNAFPSKEWQLNPYLIWGFPSKRTVKLTEIFNTLVGTRFFSLGQGLEVSYSPINSLKEWLIFFFQERFLHFFSRHWFPIFDKKSIIHPGNATDILFSTQYRKMLNVIEAGYNPTFFTNIKAFTPAGTIDNPSFVRNGIYAVFAHVFLKFPIVGKHITIVGFGVNYSWSKLFDTKSFASFLALTTIF